MGPHAFDSMLPLEDDLDGAPLRARAGARRRPGIAVETLAWVVLVLLSLGPVIGFLLAEWLG